MDVRSRKMRETNSSDRARVSMKQTRLKPELQKLQVIYYLTRNGHLEHPHFMEVTHLAHQHLRLKDVIDRLTALRGRGMPLMYSWSCKRSYKNGYVWNDLSENDIIYPTEGAEIVLKGSEIIEGCSERFEHLRVLTDQVLMKEPNIHSKRCIDINLNTSKNRYRSNSDQEYVQQIDMTAQNGEEEEEAECEYYEEKTSSASSTTPHSRCSRGVSTDELEENENETNKTLTESTPNNNNAIINSSPSPTTWFSNSALLQLISCGNSSFAKPTRQNMPSSKANGVGYNGDLRVEVLCKNAVDQDQKADRESGNNNDDDKEMIKYMSENPRFGNMQSEEKEYFSGSIVESAVSEDRVGGETVPILKKSNSYNEERSKKVESSQEIAEEEKVREKQAKLRCIPRKKSSSKTTK